MTLIIKKQSCFNEEYPQSFTEAFSDIDCNCSVLQFPTTAFKIGENTDDPLENVCYRYMYSYCQYLRTACYFRTLRHGR